MNFSNIDISGRVQPKRSDIFTVNYSHQALYIYQVSGQNSNFLFFSMIPRGPEQFLIKTSEKNKRTNFGPKLGIYKELDENSLR
jgi:hypothetical protein